MVCRDDVSLAGGLCQLEGLICKQFSEDGDLTTVAKVYRGSLTSFSASSWMTSPSGLHARSLLSALREGCASPCCRLKNTRHAAGSMWQTVRSSREVGHEVAGRNPALRVLRDPRVCFGGWPCPHRQRLRNRALHSAQSYATNTAMRIVGRPGLHAYGHMHC